MSRFLALILPLLLVVACPPRSFADEGTTLYGSARGQARQISSASLATPFTPGEWEKTITWKAAPTSIPNGWG
jgi:hypothetical protein